MTTSSAAAAARFNAPGTRAQDLDTPCLVLDLDAMERNMKKMAAYAAEHKVLLRPHAKMHKCAEIARMQMALGAVGVCVQKVSEAEALAAGGINNIFVSNEVLHAPKLRRLVAVGRLFRDMAQAAAAADAEGSDSKAGCQRWCLRDECANRLLRQRGRRGSTSGGGQEHRARR
jgi:D-serine deaminase-like pyridoxal phosphate-dependent protein